MNFLEKEFDVLDAGVLTHMIQLSGCKLKEIEYWLEKIRWDVVKCISRRWAQIEYTQMGAD
jgi:hypothetical protein